MKLAPAQKIDPPDWMNSPPLRAVFAALATDQAVAALFVGGCVRNLLLGKPVDDIDIATIHSPDRVIERLEAAGIKAVPTGYDHGTITAVIERHSYEITTLRRDVATDGRRAVVAYTADWREDAQRRDFTINTLLADRAGHIYDPLGRGLSDLAARAVVFVGDPAQRIAEDYLRILRFFRFHARYGRGPAQPEALAACRAGAGQIESLSRERISDEFFKILAVDKPADILGLMFENKVLPDLAGPGYRPERLATLARWQDQHDAPDIMARLVLLGSGMGDYLAHAERWLIFSNQQKKHFTALCDAAALAKDTEKHLKLLIYKFDRAVALQAVLILAATDGSDPVGHIGQIRQMAIPVLPLGGADIMAAGIAKGPAVGAALRQIEAWWIAQDFAPDRSACLKKLAALVGAADGQSV